VALNEPLQRPRADADVLAGLRDPATIRLRCGAITRAVSEGRSGWFRIDRSRLSDAAERVAKLTIERFPELRIPYHSRWRHFEAGGVDRKAELDAALARHDRDEQARARFDLTVVSVLLDAGAGASWRYEEPAGSGEPPRSFVRSEGLGVATFRAFMAGAFAVDRLDPLRCDAAALQRIDAAALREVFQVGPGNPLVGLEGRAALLLRLGNALRHEATQDGLPPRPGLLYDRLVAGGRSRIDAADVLGEVLRCFGPIWTSGSVVSGVTGGDIWPHRFAGDETPRGRDVTTAGWVPFHKLSQWLTYSLLEPLQWAGVQVKGLDALTGLPEYRNGGLLLDTGLVVPRNLADLQRQWKPGDEFVVEWRALTVSLLDEIAARVRERLHKSAEELPLACILEGGTWAAGRQIAAERRSGGVPPLQIESDGTVF
jgi:hypothetical protein